MLTAQEQDRLDRATRRVMARGTEYIFLARCLIRPGAKLPPPEFRSVVEPHPIDMIRREYDQLAMIEEIGTTMRRMAQENIERRKSGAAP